MHNKILSHSDISPLIAITRRNLPATIAGHKNQGFPGIDLPVKKPRLVYRIRTCKKIEKTAPDPFFEGKLDFERKTRVYPLLKQFGTIIALSE
jgi:hypothetical protein